MTKKESLIQQFVNLYRQNWNTNSGLDKNKLQKMSTKELERCIDSQQRLLSINS